MNKQRLLDTFLELVKISSESQHEKPVTDYLVPKLEGLGLEVHVDDAGSKVGSDTGNIIAKLPGTLPGAICFSSHQDTVVPGINVKPQIKDGLITSDGTTILGADDKAGLAAILEMLQHYQDKPHPTIELALDICEEIGLRGAFQIDLSKLESKKAIILDVDGAPGRIITTAPYQDICKVKIDGKPAHAGIVPEKGISAIQTAAIAIANMKLGRLDSETTANIGIITGGKATNIVAAECFFSFEARSISEDKLNNQVEHMLSEIEKACAKTGAKFTVEREHVFKGYNFSTDSKLLKLLTKSAGDVSIKPSLEISGGGSVANVFNAKGLETCVVSCGMENPHTLEEKILVCDLEKTTEWVVRIVELVGEGW
ncbi:MAG: M20/M25/M40 family metallo-hydrolase [Caldisericia bacterium]|nr:M20/M25/M40 family metallo-hydrolase [Caldisericia bacterium]